MKKLLLLLVALMASFRMVSCSESSSETGPQVYLCIWADGGFDAGQDYLYVVSTASAGGDDFTNIYNSGWGNGIVPLSSADDNRFMSGTIVGTRDANDDNITDDGYGLTN